MRLVLLHISEPGEIEEPDARPLIGAGLRWAGGLAVPMLLGLYGAIAAVNREVLLPTEPIIALFDGAAVAFGIGIIGFAAMLHLHLFWDSLYESTRASARGKFLCMLAMGICAYFLCFRLLNWV